MKDRGRFYTKEFTRGDKNTFILSIPDKKSEGGRKEFICPAESIPELLYFCSLGIVDFSSFLPENVIQNIKSMQWVGTSKLSVEVYVGKIKEQANVQRSLWVGRDTDKHGVLREIPPWKLSSDRRHLNMVYIMEILKDYGINPDNHRYHGRIESAYVNPLYVLSDKKSSEVLFAQMKKYSIAMTHVTEEHLQQLILQMLNRNPEAGAVLKPLIEK